jgi:broad specificity phosphatase PhoE
VVDARILLVRHGETDWNTDGLVQGRSDLPLDARGLVQAADAAAALVGRGIRRVVSSPLQRATQTAEVIAEALGLDGFDVDDDLVEQAFGRAEGLRWADATARYPEGVPGMEERPSVVARAAAALERWAVPGETIAVVTHRGVINALRLSVGEHPDTVTPAFGNAAIHELVLADGRLRAVDEPG